MRVDLGVLEGCVGGVWRQAGEGGVPLKSWLAMQSAERTEKVRVLVGHSQREQDSVNGAQVKRQCYTNRDSVDAEQVSASGKLDNLCLVECSAGQFVKEVVGLTQ